MIILVIGLFLVFYIVEMILRIKWKKETKEFENVFNKEPKRSTGHKCFNDVCTLRNSRICCKVCDHIECEGKCENVLLDYCDKQVNF